jgi:hypothetical protein
LQQQTKERWQNLCAKAAVEQDSEKLMELVGEIDRLLYEQERFVQKPRHSHIRARTQVAGT